MTPRGNRLACTLRTLDHCQGTFSAFAGPDRATPGVIEPVSWDREPGREVLEATFTLIGEIGMTGQIILLNQYQWRALVQAKLEPYFYGAIIWGQNPFKVIDDAEFIANRRRQVPAGAPAGHATPVPPRPQ